MKDFPSCFAENGVQVADASCTTLLSSSTTTVSKSKPKPSQNIVTCIYQSKFLGKSRLIIITWTKNLVGHCFSLEIQDLSHKSLSKLDVKPSIFSKRKGSKILLLDLTAIDVYWDLTHAKFGSTPEPIQGFYLGLAFKGQTLLLIGDLRKQIFASQSFSNSLILKREHVFGNKVFATKAQFKDNGEIHDLRIECDTGGSNDPRLVVRLGSKIVMQVKHLVWKFRGNYTISIDGLPVEVYWDVHNWLFGSTTGSAVFMFQTCSGVGKGRELADLCTGSQSLKESRVQCPGFCLTLYAWKNE